MAELVDLIDNFLRIGNSLHADFRPRRGSGSDGDFAHADDSLPDSLGQIGSAHVFDPDFILVFGDPSLSDDDSLGCDPVARKMDVDPDIEQDQESDQNHAGQKAEQNSPPDSSSRSGGRP